MIFHSERIPASSDNAGCILQKDVNLALFMMDGLDNFHPNSIMASIFRMSAHYMGYLPVIKYVDRMIKVRWKVL